VHVRAAAIVSTAGTTTAITTTRGGGGGVCLEATRVEAQFLQLDAWRRTVELQASIVPTER
jgi:hypothetical protein